MAVLIGTALFIPSLSTFRGKKRLTMDSLQYLEQRMTVIRESGRLRRIPTVSATTPEVVLSEQTALLFCSNNYLGIADHPLLMSAATEAVMRYGCSSGASRLVSGNLPLYNQLEDAVARWKQTETALVFANGFAANTGSIAALAGPGDLIFSDRLNHASIIDGALASGARLIRYPHTDYAALERRLAASDGNGLKLIISDGVFSMDGDYAAIDRLVELAEQYQALLMIDDAHGGGILGPEGRGTAAMYGVDDRVTIQMGTFGKALGSSGAYLACSAAVREYLVNHARSLIFSTALPPAALAASLAAVTLVRSQEGDALRKRLSDNIALLHSLLQQGGVTTTPGITPIIPIMVGSEERALRLSRELLSCGVYVQAIRPPTVPAGTSRLRLTVMASHTVEQIRQAAHALIHCLLDCASL